MDTKNVTEDDMNNDKTNDGSIPPYYHIKKVIYSAEKKLTVCIWSDGTRTSSKADGDDVYDPMVGLALCISKKYYKNFYKYANKLFSSNKAKDIDAEIKETDNFKNA